MRSIAIEKMLFAVGVTASALVLPLLSAETAHAQIRPGFDAGVLGANDDGSTAAQNIGFTINYFGNNFSQLFVNNNGNVTFNAPLATFTPFGLTGNIGTPIIAPFFADVDTRGAGSGLVSFGTGTANGRTAYGVNWPLVGYFSSQVNRLNDFQLILIERFDTGAGNFDIEFNYEQIQWETGGASGGVDGLGGESARVGYSSGTGTPGQFFEFTGSGVNGAFLDGGPNALITNSNIGVPGRYLFTVRNGSVSGGGSAPEPGTMALLLMALPAGYAVARRKRN
jgi:hypothetical protein